MNAITTTQNDELALKLLRARSRTYAVATRVTWVQATFAIGLPIASEVWTQGKAYIAAVSLAFVLADMLFDRWQRALIVRAAKLGELFDCQVLEMRWDEFTSGEKIEAEQIHTLARRCGERKAKQLIDWYPEDVAAVPLAYARLICQRSNVRYDTHLRGSYLKFVVSVAAAIFVTLFGLALWRNATMTQWVLSMTPGIPIFAWAIREFWRQRHAIETQSMIGREVKAIWRAALDDKCGDDECMRRSRRLQNAIYNYRATTPLILPFVYRFHRKALEEEMDVGAKDLVAEYQSAVHV